MQELAPQETVSSHLVVMPHELLLAIFKWLNPESLGNLRRVCRILKIIAEDKSLWQPLLCKYLPTHPLVVKPVGANYSEPFIRWYKSQYAKVDHNARAVFLLVLANDFEGLVRNAGLINIDSVVQKDAAGKSYLTVASENQADSVNFINATLASHLVNSYMKLKYFVAFNPLDKIRYTPNLIVEYDKLRDFNQGVELSNLFQLRFHQIESKVDTNYNSDLLLIEPIKNDDVKSVYFLLKLGTKAQNVLKIAIHFSSELVSCLLKSHLKDLSIKRDCLSLALQTAKKEIFVLLWHEANITTSYELALLVKEAAFYKRVDCLKLLIEKVQTIPITSIDLEMYNNVLLEALSVTNNVAVVEFLLASRKVLGLDLDGRTINQAPLYQAAQINAEYVRLLAEAGARIINHSKVHPLELLVFCKDEQQIPVIINNFITYYQADLNMRTTLSDNTLLHLAVCHGNAALVSELCSRQVDVNTANRYGETTLEFATDPLVFHVSGKNTSHFRTALPIFRKLIQSKAKLTPIVIENITNNKHTSTPNFSLESMVCRMQILIMNKAIPNDMVEFFHRIVSNRLPIEILRALLIQGIDVNSTYEGFTLLDTAVKFHNPDAVELLLLHGASPTTSSAPGRLSTVERCRTLGKDNHLYDYLLDIFNCHYHFKRCVVALKNTSKRTFFSAKFGPELMLAFKMSRFFLHKLLMDTLTSKVLTNEQKICLATFALNKLPYDCINKDMKIFLRDNDFHTLEEKKNDRNDLSI